MFSYMYLFINVWYIPIICIYMQTMINMNLHMNWYTCTPVCFYINVYVLHLITCYTNTITNMNTVYIHIFSSSGNIEFLLPVKPTFCGHGILYSCFPRNCMQIGCLKKRLWHPNQKVEFQRRSRSKLQNHGEHYKMTSNRVGKRIQWCVEPPGHHILKMTALFLHISWSSNRLINHLSQHSDLAQHDWKSYSISPWNRLITPHRCFGFALGHQGSSTWSATSHHLPSPAAWGAVARMQPLKSVTPDARLEIWW